MHLTFIQPSVGRKPDGLAYPASWLMEPLSLAALSGLTPCAHERTFADDRLEPIPYDCPTDLVCLSVETYTARRAYQIASEYRRRGVRVVLGGFHPTLLPDEASMYADAIVTGEAELVWAELLDDAAAGTLKPRYAGPAPVALAGLTYDRSIYAERPYARLALVETSRGCRHACEFCSIAAFFQQRYRPRPVPEIVHEIRGLRRRNVFFVDDNLGVDPERLRELCLALQPLHRRWIGQLSLAATHDGTLLRMMRSSGCEGVLIGFESLNPAVLGAMGKTANAGGASSYEEAIGRLRRHGLSVYATFVFGYDGDTRSAFDEALRFAIRQKVFFCAFNHLVPFPGTRLFTRLRAQGRLLHDAWWLDDRFRFGDVAFQPAGLAPGELAALCHEYRMRFYGYHSSLRRGLDFRANCRTPAKALFYFSQSVTGRREIRRRRGLPLGFPQGVL